jgi:phenylacetate-CoA ligase
MRSLRLKELAALVGGLVTVRRFLARTPFWSRDRMRAWQFDRIRRLVAHAYHTVPFYRRLYDSVSFAPSDLKSWNDFHRLPVVTKDQVIANYPDGMLQAGADREALIVSRSSGSSGQVLDIAYDAKAMTTYVLAGLRLYQMAFRYRPWHRQVYVYTSPYPLNSLFGLYPLHFLSTLTPIPEIIAALKRIRPHLLVCYPSHLKQIVQEAPPGELGRLCLRAVSVNSEMSTQAERDALAAQLSCPVLDEYSSEELTRIAAQCRHRTYHLFEDINYVEVLPGQGTVVGTNLHNFAMPMIRYQQNDLGAIAEGECACGWRFRHLRDLQGRKNDSFVLPSGRTLTSGFLLDATYEFLLAHRTAVRDFCLIQRAADEIVLEVVPGAGWGEPVETAVAARFREFLEPGVRFAVTPVGECQKTRTGKRNPIINLTGRTPTSR